MTWASTLRNSGVRMSFDANARFAAHSYLYATMDGLLVFPLGYDARLRHQISAVGVRKKRRRGIHCELFYARRHIVLALEHLVKRNFPTSVGGHAAHARTKLASTPRLTSLYGLLSRMASTKSFHSF